MSILIKDMEMPKEGRLTLQISADGAVYVVDSCSITAETYTTDAVPVPPHGRLGDLDALYKEALKRSETKDGYYDCLEPVISCYTIDHAPTIIPAEPSDEQREYEAAVDAAQYCEMYEPTYDPETGAM